MNRKKSLIRTCYILLIFIFLNCNLFALEHLSETETEINKVKTEIENDIADNGFNRIEKNANVAFSGDGTRLSLEIESGHENTGVYNWTLEETPLVKIKNDGVINTNNGNPIRVMRPKYVYIENNGTITNSNLGGVGNQHTIVLEGGNTSKTYIKNTGIIENNNDPRDVDATIVADTNLGLDNYGKIISHNHKVALYNYGKNSNIINRQGAEIISKNGKAIDYTGAGNIVNEGKIKGDISTRALRGLIKFTNNGEIEGNITTFIVPVGGNAKINYKNRGIIKGNVTLGNTSSGGLIDEYGILGLFDTRTGKVEGDLFFGGGDQIAIVDDKTEITGSVEGNKYHNNKLIIHKGVSDLGKYEHFDNLELVGAEVETNNNLGDSFGVSVNIDDKSKFSFSDGVLKSDYVKNDGEIIVKKDFILENGYENPATYNNPQKKLINKGTITFEDNGTAKTLTLQDKKYVGDNGTLKMNVSDNDNSLLKTKSSSGTTKIVLNNKLTKKIDDNGIKLVENESSTSNAFYLDDASKENGSHIYDLIQKNTYDWYLIELLNNKIGTYGIISNSAKELLNNRLEDRISIVNVKNNNIWVRPSYIRSNNLLDEFSVDSNIYQVKVGSDIKHWEKQEYDIDLGVFGTFGGDVSLSKSNNNPRESKSNLNMLSAGVYSTIQNKEKGMTLDLWANYGLGLATLEKVAGNKDKLITQGWAISGELNQDILLDKNLYLQYQGQAVYQGTHVQETLLLDIY